MIARLNEVIKKRRSIEFIYSTCRKINYLYERSGDEINRHPSKFDTLNIY